MPKKGLLGFSSTGDNKWRRESEGLKLTKEGNKRKKTEKRKLQGIQKKSVAKMKTERGTGKDGKRGTIRGRNRRTTGRKGQRD